MAFTLSQLDTFVHPKLLQCDVSFNEVATLDTVEAFARRSLELKHLDLTSNPLLATTEWKVWCCRGMSNAVQVYTPVSACLCSLSALLSHTH